MTRPQNHDQAMLPNDDALALRQQNDYLTALHEMSLGLINRLDINELLQEIVSRAIALIGADHGYIYLLCDDGETMEVRIVVGSDWDITGRRLVCGEGLSGRVWQTGLPIVVDDYSSWPARMREYSEYDQLHALAGVPLKSGLQVVGVLGVAYFNPNVRFSNDDLVVLGQFAELAAIALDNARLYTTAQAQLAERERAEQALRESESRYRILSELASDYIYILRFHDNHTEVQWVSDSFTRATGYTLEAVQQPRAWRNLIYREDYSLVRRKGRDVLAGKQISTFEVRIVATSGEVHWTRHRIHCMPDPSLAGGLRVYGVAQDVTDERMAFEALRTSEQRYRALFEYTSDGVIILDLQGNTIAVNRQLSEMLGFAPGELTGSHIKARIAPEQLADAHRRWHALLAGEQLPIYERTFIAKDGRRVAAEISVTLVRDEQGNPIHVQGIIHDITQRKQAEAQLQLLSSAIRSSSEAIVITSAPTADAPQPLVLYANEAYFRATGYTPDELIGKSAQVLRTAAITPEVEAKLNAALAANRSVRFEALSHHQNGSTFWAEFSFEPIRDEQGCPLYWVAVQRDITEHKEHEQQLVYLSTHDYLTDLPNRRALEERLMQVVAVAHDDDQSALLFIDLDNFKAVNDTTPLGHEAGDLALTYLAAIFSRRLRDNDILARLGGDEFAVLLEHTPQAKAEQIASRLSAAVARQPVIVAGYSFNVTLSVGLVVITGQQSARTVLFQADTAMYIAKKQGGNRVITYSSE